MALLFVIRACEVDGWSVLFASTVAFPSPPLVDAEPTPPPLLPGTMIFCRAASVVENNIPQEPPLLLLLAPHPGGDSTAAPLLDVALCST